MIVVLETSADHRLHFHCIIERPYSLLDRAVCSDNTGTMVED